MLLRLINHYVNDKNFEEKPSADYYKDVSKAFKFYLPLVIMYYVISEYMYLAR